MTLAQHDSERVLENALKNWDYQRWTLTCRAMMVRIAVDRNAERAIDLLTNFARQPRRLFATIDTPPGGVFTTRIANALEEGGYFDLQSLRVATDEDLLELDNIDTGAVHDIRQAIEEVLTGQRYEFYGPSEADLDEELCVRIGSFSSPSPAVKEPVQMSASDELKKALATIAANGPAALVAIDEEIAQHEAEIERLRSMRRMLAPKSTTLKMNAEHRYVADSMAALLAKTGPMTPTEIAKRVNSGYIVVGKIAKADSRFSSNGRQIALAS